jgi:mRNA deadenylase 3'-5' endonuclease subunit Ccr4
MIDYVFYSEGLRVQATEELPEEGEFDKEVGLPSSVFPSDHLPLVCTFEWTVKE